MQCPKKYGIITNTIFEFMLKRDNLRCYLPVVSKKTKTDTKGLYSVVNIEFMIKVSASVPQSDFYDYFKYNDDHKLNQITGMDKGNKIGIKSAFGMQKELIKTNVIDNNLDDNLKKD